MHETVMHVPLVVQDTQQQDMNYDPAVSVLKCSFG